MTTPAQMWRSIVREGKERAKVAVLSLVTPRIPLPPDLARRRVIFIGASVGHAWRLPLVFPNLETRAVYAFDKTEAVRDAIASRPDAVILKECAAYFPNEGIDFALVEQWVAELRAAGIRPVLATVAPITRELEAREPGRAAALWAFNDRLRDYASSERLPLLDLERALRVSTTDRYLRPGLDTGDGLHLARKTYRYYLDHLIPPLLAATFAEE
ncbi:MAG: hypothetical protein IT371_21140 [Deltaproteobacteria bacterium]|nr:hypothetical protein [Deltaproteobacteria bacterium]